MRLYVLVFAILFSSGLAAQPAKKMLHPEIPKGEERIKAGTMILISKFDKPLNAYLVKISSNGAIGPLYADLESLSSSIATIKSERVKNSPDSIVSNFYTTDKDLRLLTDAAIASRRASIQH